MAAINPSFGLPSRPHPPLFPNSWLDAAGGVATPTPVAGAEVVTGGRTAKTPTIPAILLGNGAPAGVARGEKTVALSTHEVAEAAEAAAVRETVVTAATAAAICWRSPPPP